MEQIVCLAFTLPLSQKGKYGTRKKRELVEISCASDITTMKQKRGETSRRIVSHSRYNLLTILSTQNLAKIIF